jgi:hypothetical protein
MEAKEKGGDKYATEPTSFAHSRKNSLDS